jgi:hypothetical protein
MIMQCHNDTRSQIYSRIMRGSDWIESGLTGRRGERFED